MFINQKLKNLQYTKLTQTIIRILRRSFNKKIHNLYHMDIFRRIGTQKKKFKIQFFIGRLKFSAFRAGQIYIVIKRGEHKIKSEQRLQMSEDCKLNFNKEIMQFEATLYFDEKDNLYQQKTGQLSVVLLDQKDNKILLGVVPFDIATFANSGQQSIKQNKKLQNTPKKIQGRIEYNVFIKYIGEGSESSVDKVSGFFFGKTKQQTETQNEKQKTNRGESKKKAHENTQNKKDKRSVQSPQQENNQMNFKTKTKTKAKQKVSTKAQQQKHKGWQQNITNQQIDSKPSSVPKNYVTTNKNNQKAYLTSDNEQQKSKKAFYFDEPMSTQHYVEQNKNLGNLKDKNIEQKHVKQYIKGAKSNKINIEKMIRNSQSEEGSQAGDDIQTSEVEPVDTNKSNLFVKTNSLNKFKPFSKSQASSLKEEPIKIKIKQSHHDNATNSFQQKQRKEPSSFKSREVEKIKDRENERVKDRENYREAEKRQREPKAVGNVSGEKRQKLVEYLSQRQKGNKYFQPGYDNQKQKPIKFQLAKEPYKVLSNSNQSEDQYDFNTNVSSIASHIAQQQQQDQHNSYNGRSQLSKNSQRKKQFIKGPNFKKSIIQELLPGGKQKQFIANKNKGEKSQQFNSFKQLSDQQQPNIITMSQDDVQQLTQQNKSLKKTLSTSESVVKQLQIQLATSHQQLVQLSDQIDYYQSELKQKQQELLQQKNNHVQSNQSLNQDRTALQKHLQQLRKIEKQKNQLIVENSKLKEKHRKDLSKYDQLLQEKQSQQQQTLSHMKANMLRLKQENSTLRDKLQKVTHQNSLRTSQNTKQKTLLTAQQAELTEVKQSLSQIKFKICTLLNEALATGESTAIELLMDLNKH